MARYVIFPGTAGSYADTPDVNLLDADTAHIEQSIGLWLTVFNVSRDLVAHAGTPIGSNAERLTGTGAGSQQVRTNKDVVPVSSSTEYTVSVWLEAVEAGDLSLGVDEYDVGGVFLGSAGTTTVSFAAGESRYIDLTATSRGTATSWDLKAVRLAGQIGEVFYLGAAILRTGSVGTFVPSLRIVGDVDMRAKVDIVDVTDGQALISTFGTNVGYELRISSDTLTCSNGDGLTARIRSTPIIDGAATYRSTFDVSTGQWTFYIDGIAQGLPATRATGAGIPANVALKVGERSIGGQDVEGDIYTASVRDGIDGPIVAVFDAEDIGL